MSFKSSSPGEVRSVSYRRGQRAGGAVNHVVHFYGADNELADSVGRYLADGIRSGDGVLVVATAPHCLAFEAKLLREGLDVDRERRAGRLFTVDACGLLGSFLADGRLDHDRFE